MSLLFAIYGINFCQSFDYRHMNCSTWQERA